MNIEKIIEMMYELDKFAMRQTTDPSIYVGACVGNIIDDQFLIEGIGANSNLHYNEKKLGYTYREFLFGSRDTKYRPWDKIVHAEENAIVDAIKKWGRPTDTNRTPISAAVVTRYPCEKCAQLMVYKGIRTVYYGRSFPISEETAHIFKTNAVEVIHVKEYTGPSDDTNCNVAGGKN